MQNIVTNDILPVEIQLSGSQYQVPENASPQCVSNTATARRELSFYEKSRTFNDSGLDSIIKKKLRHTIQTGLECSSIVQELVLGHTEEAQWKCRRKEYFRRSSSRRVNFEANRLKNLQCRNPLMTIFDNVVLESSLYFKRLFAA